MAQQATKTKFDAAFIERRMAEHKRQQHRDEYAMLEEIIEEVQALPKRKPRTGYLFMELPEPIAPIPARPRTAVQ